LTGRRIGLVEHGDRPDADPAVVRDTLLTLASLNGGVLRTHALLASLLRPLLEPAGRLRILDLGCGAGDCVRALARAGARAGCTVEAVGVDRSPEAVGLARTLSEPGDGTTYLLGDALGPEADPSGFDVVVSSSFLHHLPDDRAVADLFRRSARARRGFAHLDLARSGVAHALFRALGRPFCRRRETFEDGLVSILRSFAPDELRALLGRAGVAARVETRFPWRLCAWSLDGPRIS
jgi:SAM-dependent methyltransferase